MRASYAPRDVWKRVSRTPLRATPHYMRADPSVESVVKRYCESGKCIFIAFYKGFSKLQNKRRILQDCRLLTISQLSSRRYPHGMLFAPLLPHHSIVTNKPSVTFRGEHYLGISNTVGIPVVFVCKRMFADGGCSSSKPEFHFS